MKIKERFKTWKNKIKMFWGDLQESKEDEIVKLGTILNYGVTSGFLSVPLFTLSLIYYKPTILRFFLIMLSLWCLLPFVEYYYLWFRELWRDDLIKK